MKGKVAFRQPLSPQALAWLDRVPPNATPWLWPNRLGTAPTLSRIYDWVTRAGFAPPPHSLRKAMATWLAGKEISDGLIGLLLSHTPQGVTSVYQKNDRLEERRAALDAWGAVLALR
jgi:integrase